MRKHKAALKKGTLELARRDPILKKLIRSAGPADFGPRNEQSLFDSLLRSIVYQQLHGKAAATILGRVQALFPKKEVTPARLLKMDTAKLRAAGLSANKMAAVLDLALKAKAGELPEEAELAGLSNTELIERITKVRGIGPWTVQMLLIFKLGRLDVLPSSDFGVQAGYQLAYGKRKRPTPKQLERAVAHWAPFESIGAWYMWRAIDLHRAKKAKTKVD